MFVWDRGRRASAGTRSSVQRDLARLSDAAAAAVSRRRRSPSQSNGKNVVLSGKVSSKDVDRQGRRTSPRATSKRKKTSSTCCSAGARRHQSGAAARALRRGEPQRADRARASTFGCHRLQGRPLVRPHHDAAVRRARQWDEAEGKFVFSDFLNLFLFDTKNSLAGVIKALQTRACSRASPNRTWSRKAARKRASWPAANSRSRSRRARAPTSAISFSSRSSASV